MCLLVTVFYYHLLYSPQDGVSPLTLVLASPHSLHPAYSEITSLSNAYFLLNFLVGSPNRDSDGLINDYNSIAGL